MGALAKLQPNPLSFALEGGRTKFDNLHLQICDDL
jgi:hypothetical protein